MCTGGAVLTEGERDDGEERLDLIGRDYVHGHHARQHTECPVEGEDVLHHEAGVTRQVGVAVPQARILAPGHAGLQAGVVGLQAEDMVLHVARRW